MLKKVEIRIMEPTTDPIQFLRELEVFEIRAKEAAFTLYTLYHLSVTVKKASSYTVIASKLLSITALLPTLRWLIDPTLPSSRLDLPASRGEKIGILARSVARCEPLLEGIDKTVEGLGETRLLMARNEGENKEEFFTPFSGSEEDALKCLDACFRDVMVALTAARVGRLSLRGYLTDREVAEKLRLKKALEHPEYNTHPELRELVFLPFPRITDPTPKQMEPVHRPPSPPPHRQRDVIELQHPDGFRGRYGHPDYPSLMGEKAQFVQLSPDDPRVKFERSFEESESERAKLSAEGRYPNITAFSIWPPSFPPNTIQDRQIQRVLASTAMAQLPFFPPSTTESPVQTPGSTQESTPVVESHKETVSSAAELKDDKLKEPPIQKETEEVTPKLAVVNVAEIEDNQTSTSQDTATEDSRKPLSGFATEPASQLTSTREESAGEATPKPSSGKAKDMTLSSDANTDSPSVLPNPVQQLLNPPPTDPGTPTHLEAYVIRPVCEDTYSAVEWTYKTEPLPLDDASIQAHLRSLGDTHSIIDDICTLHPEQLRLIKIRAKHRRGTLVSAQPSKAVDMLTKMGTFQVKGVVYVIRTGKEVDDQEDKDLETFNVLGKKIFPPLFGKPAPVEAFGNSSAPTSGFGAWGSNPAPTSGFGAWSAPKSGFGALGSQETPTSGFGAATRGSNPASTFGFGSGFGNPALSSGFGAWGSNPTSTNPAPTSSFGLPPESSRGKPKPTTDGVKQFRQTLQERGETCTYAELNFGTIDHYQTVIPLLSKDVSFEELRQVEVEGGRTGPKKDNGFSYPWDQPKPYANSSLFELAPPSASTTLFGQPASTGSGGLFGTSSATGAGTGGLFGSATQSGNSTGGLFGSSNRSALAPGRGLFGSAQPTSSSGGLFGSSTQTAAQRTSLFGTTQSSSSRGGLFGSSTQTAPAPGSGLFGSAQPTASSGGLFGTSNHAALPSTSLFETAQASSSSNDLAGSPKNERSTASLFGHPQPTTSRSNISGLFGDLPPPLNIANTSSLFGSARAAPPATSGSGLFEGTPAQAPAGSFGLFGGYALQTQPDLLEGPLPTNAAPAPSAGLFGSSAAQNTNSQPTSGSNPFGPAGSSSLFGAALATTTAPAPTSGLFGSSVSSQLATTSTPSQSTPAPGSNIFATLAAPSTGLFGNSHPTTTTGRFGNPPSISLFGTGQHTSPMPSGGLSENRNPRSFHFPSNTQPQPATSSAFHGCAPYDKSSSGGSIFSGLRQNKSAASSSIFGATPNVVKGTPSLFEPGEKRDLRNVEPWPGAFGSSIRTNDGTPSLLVVGKRVVLTTPGELCTHTPADKDKPKCPATSQSPSAPLSPATKTCPANPEGHTNNEDDKCLVCSMMTKAEASKSTGAGQSKEKDGEGDEEGQKRAESGSNNGSGGVEIGIVGSGA